MAASSLCPVTESIRGGLIEIIQKLNSRYLQYHEADYSSYKWERVETILCQYAHLSDIEDRIFGCISEVKYLMKNQIQKGDEKADGFHCEEVFNGDRGSPRHYITAQQLEYFLAFGFTATEISVMRQRSNSRKTHTGIWVEWYELHKHFR